MTYAIVETSGKQLRLEPGWFYDVDRVGVDLGGEVILDRVLLISHDSGVHVGQPLVIGATVETKVLKHYRGKKILVYKMKPKKKTRKKRGHRQELTRLLVHSITLDGTILASHETENRKPGAILSDPLPSMALPDGD